MATGQHLTQEQVSAWMLGERSAKVQEHVRSCSACQSEVLLLGTTLLDFRSSVREWSQEHASPNVIPLSAAMRDRLVTFNRLCLATAAVVVCILVGLTLRTQPPGTSPVNAISDKALMSQMDEEISRTVPTAMEPLVQLVAWQGDAHTDAHPSAANASDSEGANK